MKPTLLALLCLALLNAVSPGHGAELKIDASFPGGNITVDRIEGDAILLRPDLRDTNGDWFYWAFRVTGAAGRTLAFTFSSDRYSARGPAISTDGGGTWLWMGREAVKDRTFRHTFLGDGEVRFSMGMPYTEANLNAFLQRYATNAALRKETLCRTDKGRTVEFLRFGQVGGAPRLCVFLTARHHACEMMANYALEGIMQAALADDSMGRWFRENVEVRAVPFMDKDGVEDGDQGKNRRPHDHNRDYAGEPLYASVAAVKQMLPAWSGGRLRIALDLHCPGLRGRGHEVVHFVGGPEVDFWHRTLRLSAGLEELSTPGLLSFRASDNLPFGQSWNIAERGLASSFASWARTIPGLRIGTTLELPYATSNGQEVNADSARAFGRVLAAALQAYLLEDRE